MEIRTFLAWSHILRNGDFIWKRDYKDGVLHVVHLIMCLSTIINIREQLISDRVHNMETLPFLLCYAPKENDDTNRESGRDIHYIQICVIVKQWQDSLNNERNHRGI